MAWNANIIEKAMQLANDGCHLGGKVACIHRGHLGTCDGAKKFEST